MKERFHRERGVKCVSFLYVNGEYISITTMRESSMSLIGGRIGVETIRSSYRVVEWLIQPTTLLLYL